MAARLRRHDPRYSHPRRQLPAQAPRSHRLPGRLPRASASHEFILTFAKQAKDNHVTALDIAKRLLDYNQHAPTIYSRCCRPGAS
ncbi:MAG: hypothetical protein ABJQ98_16545 [Alloalcanivorax venustensis]|uniref:hypothetical protein n=1 Tax=Alloalcanivorax venustensis TaxID=172371 RepID=UPI003297DFB4